MITKIAAVMGQYTAGRLQNLAEFRDPNQQKDYFLRTHATKAAEAPTPLKKAIGTGAVAGAGVGAIIGAIARGKKGLARSLVAKGAVGAGIGGLVGGATKASDDADISKSKRILAKQEDSPYIANQVASHVRGIRAQDQERQAQLIAEKNFNYNLARDHVLPRPRYSLN